MCRVYMGKMERNMETAKLEDSGKPVGLTFQPKYSATTVQEMTG